MAVMIKCKMCGGDLQITEGSTVCECEYCGTKQTVPTLDNEKKLTLFSRAGRLLRNCEFDKASGVFESIVAEFPEEAEAYWGLVLCKYGIEYVDDPATGKKIPTCHRSSFESVLDDVNFEQACENTDAVARRVYRDEALQLEELRKSIIEVSGKEEPYDIFISYKETDENGNRTLDSVIAQDIFTELTEKGYRVFFSRISLEDKLGVEYEPYIFAALNSAKVMLVVGTDYEYFDAVWVKNEWSRFLKLIASGQKKVLIPVFKNMGPYDMPKEFSKLAAQDMGKVCAMQDLLRGVEKLLGGKKDTEFAESQNAQTINVASANPTVNSLLERAFMFAEDLEFEKANEYAEKVLDIEPKNAQAYLCKLICALEVRNRKLLSSQYETFDSNPAYLKILQFGDAELVEEIKGYNEEIKAQIRQKEEEECKAKEAAEEAERREIERRKQEIASLKEKIADLKDQKAHLEIENKSRRLRELENEIAAKTAYQSSLGFFKGSEKRAVQQEIDALEQERKRVKDSLYVLEREAKEAEAKAGTAKANYNNFKQQVLSSSTSEIDRQIQKTAVKLMVLEGEGHFGYYQGQWTEWLVLAKEESKALLISKYALDCQQYHSSDTNITWEKCTLRSWLNNTFLKAAFSPEEQKQILTTTVTADNNRRYNTNPGNNTSDKIFLLSIAEANMYFSSDSARQCKPTQYAVAQKCNVDKDSGNCWWWLRTPGFYQNFAADVYSNGSVDDSGSRVDFGIDAIRPALWINLDS